MKIHAPEITFVCCIEYGRLESQTLLMLRTLRENGGRFAEARVLVVRPRRGAPLSAETLTALQDFDAELLTEYSDNPAPWYNFANKVAAINLAEKEATTPLVAWIDSDVLVASEPTGLILEDTYDFGARGEYLLPAIYEGSAEHVPYWETVCQIVGIKVEDLPFLDFDHPDVRFRLYFNAGIYVWRRGTGFPAAYRRVFSEVLRSRVALHNGNVYMTDQVLLSAMVVKLILRWKHLSYRENHMIFPGQIEGISAAPDMSGSALIHYSASLNPPHRESLLRRIKREVPHLLPAVLAADANPPATAAQRALEVLFRGLRKGLLTLFTWRSKPARNGSAA